MFFGGKLLTRMAEWDRRLNTGGGRGEIGDHGIAGGFQCEFESRLVRVLGEKIFMILEIFFSARGK